MFRWSGMSTKPCVHRCASHPAIFCVLVLVAVLPLGCGGPRIRPEISDRATTLRFPESRHCTVLPGDTLYSIAWENGRDYRELADWNHIAPPYTIHPGERLLLFPPKRRYHAPLRPVPARREYANGNSARRVYRVPAGVPDRAQGGQHRIPPVTARAGRIERKVGPWTWPAKGKVMAHFDPDGTENGVVIAGRLGEPVLAAATGKVVYEGSGLRGYGQLIIIKHNDEYLSAYAHNERILVKEGEMVRPGQQIAEMGNTGTDRVELLFEIRRYGSPVDPMRFLPKP